MDAQIFVQNIKKFCKAKGVPTTTACKEAGVGGSFVSDVNRGQTPSVAKVQLLADYLGVTTSELLGERKKLTLPTESELDEDLITQLCSLTPAELEKVGAFVQGLLASR